MRGDQHFASDKVQSTLDGALCLELFLLQQDWSHKLVDGLILANVFEFLQTVSF